MSYDFPFYLFMLVQLKRDKCCWMFKYLTLNFLDAGEIPIKPLKGGVAEQGPAVRSYRCHRGQLFKGDGLIEFHALLIGPLGF